MHPLEARLLLAQFTLDTSFGVGGYGPVAADRLLHQLPDGKLLVASRTARDPNILADVDIVRLNSDGSLDPTFVDASDPPDSFDDRFIHVANDRMYVVGGAGPYP